MSGYIISKTSEPDRYLAFDKANKMFITNKKERAEWFADSGKAWRILNNQMPKKKRAEWGVITYDSEEVKPQSIEKRYKADLDTSALSAEEVVDWQSINKNLTNIMSSLLSYKERLSLKLSQVEAELCDCEHYCEFFKCNAADGYKMYSMIRERRIKRRFYKDELRKINSVLSFSHQEIANGEISKAFQEIESQSYEPRVLKDMFKKP